MDKTTQPDVADPQELGGIGYILVRRFLTVVTAGVGVTVVVAAGLGYLLSMDESVAATGAIETRRKARVKSEASGIVREVLVDYGQMVPAGEVVAILDRRELRSRLAKIEADIVENSERRQSLLIDLHQEKARRQAQTEQAELELAEARMLLADVRAVHELESDEFVLPFGRARLPLDELIPVREARALVERRKLELRARVQWLSDLNGPRHELRAHELAFEKLVQDRLLLEEQLLKSVVSAPLAGKVITENPIERIGDFVRVGETILELDAMEGWSARVVVAERDMPRVRVGLPARVLVEAFPQVGYRLLEGRVARISPAAGADGFRISLTIDDALAATGSGHALMHGMKATARIVVARSRIVHVLWNKLVGNITGLGQDEHSVRLHVGST